MGASAASKEQMESDSAEESRLKAAPARIGRPTKVDLLGYGDLVERRGCSGSVAAERADRVHGRGAGGFLGGASAATGADGDRGGVAGNVLRDHAGGSRSGPGDGRQAGDAVSAECAQGPADAPGGHCADGRFERRTVGGDGRAIHYGSADSGVVSRGAAGAGAWRREEAGTGGQRRAGGKPSGGVRAGAEVCRGALL